MTSKLFRFSFVFFSVLILCITSYQTLKIYQHERSTYLQGGNFVYKGGDVLGINSEEKSASVDFSVVIAQGSPLIFGGAHHPDITHTKAWEKLESVGVTSMRSDFYMDRYLPTNITLADYKNNVKNVQDTSTWNQKVIADEKRIYREAKNRGMKTIGIATYAINWLTYSNSNYGVPKDWDVYEDLIAKSYSLFRDDLDYLEVWNEPDLAFFLDVKNSSLTREEAYYEIVKHAVAAIRRIDAQKNDGKRIPIGVGVVSQPPNAKMMDKVLADRSLSSQIDFVSYHNYEHIPEPSNQEILSSLQRNKLTSMPVYLTEWAHTPKLKEKDDFVLSNQAIPYSGAKLIDFLNMGLAGANYFALQQIDGNSPRGDVGYLGFYEQKNGQSVLLPISKTWRLMSKTLGLGAGPSQVFKVSHEDDSKISAWKNSLGKYGLVLANSLDEPEVYNLSINNTPMNSQVLLTAYAASANEDGAKKLGSVVVQNKNGAVLFKVVAPANSVVGVEFSDASLIDRLPSLP